MATWVDLLRLTLRDPREGAQSVLQLQYSREGLWTLLAIVVALSVIGARIMSYLLPVAQEDVIGLGFVASPIMFALVLWGLIVLTVFCMHYIGRSFGGQGMFEDSLKLVIWLQVILLVVQVVQIFVGIVSTSIAGIIGLGFSLYSIWIFINFVAVVHRFENRLLVFGGVLVTLIGAVFGMSLLVALISILFGVEMPNG